MTKDERLAYQVDMDGSLVARMRSVRDNIRAMKDVLGLDEGEMLACVKDVYQEEEKPNE